MHSVFVLYAWNCENVVFVNFVTVIQYNEDNKSHGLLNTKEDNFV